MPPAWTSFLLAAGSYMSMYGSVENAVAAFRDGLDPGERGEVLAFLKHAVDGDEAHCRAVTTPRSGVVAASAIRPQPCLAFYNEALAAFAG